MTAMKTRRDVESRTIAEQAAEWLMILEEDRPQDREAFADWLRGSPMHVGAFLRASAVERMVEQVDPERGIEIDTGPFPDVEDLVTLLRRATDDRLRETKRPSRRVLRWVALAASIAVVTEALVTVRMISKSSWTRYTAVATAQQVQRLEDDSVIYLEAGSSIEVRFDATERRLRLTSGKATFKVHHDEKRPFRVHSGKTVVQAVGTQFTVTRERDESVVAVTEGVVQMSRERTVVEEVMGRVGMGASSNTPVTLKAGQEARAGASGEVLATSKSRLVTFADATLLEIVETFNRGNGALKFRVADEAAGQVRYGATIDPGDSEALLEILLVSKKLTVERAGSEVVIRSR
jgi:transmembrane sensor